ncbi:hypothetical protein GPECTOR_10g1055 [Gonium pectorale]|uniref:Uncharacterized protein n=1 Tax=Gonium pectorale TaxID=33097 RepID=A0A150GQL9_GONPE|nr:hypothetical protein GPECTOR_10g1055 [Gonium pectorale]|eukprot:KXZ52032.1 hypothetical protein GPECTOR_10g1055 [Gonium pectorale]
MRGDLIALSFTPATAALGGLLLGLATAGKLLTTGRVLGISGALKGLVTGDWAPWRAAFLAGMALGAMALGGLLPAALEATPATFPMWRAALAGLLVGLGTSLGNGCTSGHGISGVARLSPRSLVFMALFMAVGMATGSLAATAAAVNVAPLPPALQLPTATEVRLAATLAGAGAAAFATLAAAGWLLARRSAATAGTAAGVRDQAPAAAAAQCPAALELAAEVAAGALVTLGLGLGGMTRPSKVSGFLTLSAASWDPSLPFIMLGAVSVAMLAYQGVVRFRLMSKPALCPRFQIPTSTTIDAKLLAGGALFGVGWGLAGMCPGPALISALYGDVRMIVFSAAMAAGMWLEGQLGAALAAGASAATTAGPGKA